MPRGGRLQAAAPESAQLARRNGDVADAASCRPVQVTPTAGGGTDHEHQMVDGCDAAESHKTKVTKRAIKIRNRTRQWTAEGLLGDAANGAGVCVRAISLVATRPPPPTRPPS